MGSDPPFDPIGCTRYARSVLRMAWRDSSGALRAVVEPRHARNPICHAQHTLCDGTKKPRRRHRALVSLSGTYRRAADRPKDGSSSRRKAAYPDRYLSAGRLLPMNKPHPHEQATYSVVPFHDEFAVKVEIPDTCPTTVSKFGTRAGAEAWIAEHRRRVQADLEKGRWFQTRRKSA